MNLQQTAVDEDYATGWRAALAPRTGDVQRELTLEAAEYLGITPEESARRVATSGEDFPAEWARLVTDASNQDQVIRFYNESKAELFEQIAWHSTDPIHYRSVLFADLARTRPGRSFLDYGSGIGSNALIFGLAGFEVTLADIADPLRNFARWRCERRGVRVKTIDLKQQSLYASAYDVVTCFDVLEHVPEPVKVLKQVSQAIRPGGVFFFYAPIGYDPVRPMHIVHDASVLRRIRSLGFAYFTEWTRKIPGSLQMHSIYLRAERSAAANLAYYVRDVWLPGNSGAMLARAFRAVLQERRRMA
jgi:2-polyprenyl-6-hydroxyphenyl methylase/3-demethylubiquinone-9 3-methyltransferase